MLAVRRQKRENRHKLKPDGSQLVSGKKKVTMRTLK